MLAALQELFRTKLRQTAVRFRVLDFETRPFLAMPDPENDTPLDPMSLVARIAGGEDVVVGDDQSALIRPFVNAAALDGARSAKFGDFLCVLASIYGWGARLNAADIGRIERLAAGVTRDEVCAAASDDEWIRNFILNIWEFVHGETALTTYPWNISLPIADLCNARCIFCTSWIEGTSLVKVDQIEAFSEVISKAIYIGLVGHGEPLAHPRFGEICDIINRHMDPRAATYTITNGVYLNKWAAEVDKINVRSFSISLNAASAATHDLVMGLGANAFEKVLDGIRQIVAKNTPGDHRDVAITMVVTNQNMHEVADFVRLGNDLGVTQIWLRSLLPQTELTPGLNYHTLSPRLRPEFDRLKSEAVEAIAASRVKVQADPHMWGAAIFPPKLQAEIDLNAPVFMTREAALKDKTLRQRNLSDVYSPSAAKRRGRPKASDEHTLVEYADRKAHVTTMSAPWAYALRCNIKKSANVSGAGAVTARLFDIKGEIGVGLLDNDANEWVDRVFVTDAPTADITLNFGEQRKNLSIIVENAAENGVRSSAVVSFPEVRVPSSDWRSEINLSESAVNRPVDPYEDGDNPFNRTPRFACKAPYFNLYINEMYFRVVPCCFMTEVPGYEEIRFDGSTPFFEVWNSPAMTALRSKLNDGPLFAACKKCPEKW